MPQGQGSIVQEGYSMHLGHVNQHWQGHTNQQVYNMQNSKNQSGMPQGNMNLQQTLLHMLETNKSMPPGVNKQHMVINMLETFAKQLAKDNTMHSAFKQMSKMFMNMNNASMTTLQGTFMKDIQKTFQELSDKFFSANPTNMHMESGTGIQYNDDVLYCTLLSNLRQATKSQMS